MKKLIVLITTILFSYQISNAQTEKGSQTIGVNLGFSYNKQNNTVINQSDNSTSQNASKTTSFGIGPEYSYFIADKLDIGASLNYSATNYNNGVNVYPSEEHDKSYGGSIFLRKYFLYQNKLGFRAGPYIGYGYNEQKDTYSGSSISNTDNKTTSYNAGFDLDLVYYPSKHLGVSAALATLHYYHYKTNAGVQGNGNGDQVDFNFINNGLALSVFYVFGGK